MNSYDLFVEIVTTLIDTTASYSVYQVEGMDIITRCDWDYDNINCKDCTKYEKRYICRDKYEVLLKAFMYSESDFRNSIIYEFDRYQSKTEEERHFNMEKVIAKFLEEEQNNSSWNGNLFFSWKICETYDYL